MQRRIAIVGAFVALAVSAAGAHAQAVAFTLPESPYDALIEAANDAYAAGAFDTAVVLLREAVDRDPARHEAYNNLGVAHIDLGDYELAADWFAELAEAVRAMPPGDARAADGYVQAHDGILEAWSLLQDSWLGQADDALDDAAFSAANQRFDDVHAQAEALPLRIDGVLADPDAAELSGQVTGFNAPAGAPVRIRVRFHARAGVVDERTLTLTSPGPGAQSSFTASGPVVPVTGWTYTLED